MAETVNGHVLPVFDDTLDTDPKQDWDRLKTILEAVCAAIDTDSALHNPISATFTGVVSTSDTTQSTTVATGAIVSDGGLGVAKAVFVGGTANVAGQVNADDTTDSSSVSTGALVCDGGVGIAKKLYVGTTLNVAGQVNADATTDATSATTGALVCDGGLGVAKTVFLGASGGLKTAAGVGAAETGTTAVEHGDAKRHVTVLTVSTVLGAIAGGAALALGKLLYTFPAGAVVVHSATMSMALDELDGNITANTPDVGIGTTLASGVQALLNGAGSGAENILTGQTAADCNGTATLKTVVDQILAIEAAGDHTVYFNVADTWAASGETACPIAGTIVLEWTLLA